MSRDHHDLLRGQAEQIGGAQVNLRRGLVAAKNLGAEHTVPGKPASSGHGNHGGHVCIGKGGKDVFSLEALESRRHVGPGVA